MDLVNLMLAVEAEFDLTIPGSCMNPQNFRSVESIAKMIEQVGPAPCNRDRAAPAASSPTRRDPPVAASDRRVFSRCDQYRGTGQTARGSRVTGAASRPSDLSAPRRLAISRSQLTTRRVAAPCQTA